MENRWQGVLCVYVPKSEVCVSQSIKTPTREHRIDECALLNRKANAANDIAVDAI